MLPSVKAAISTFYSYTNINIGCGINIAGGDIQVEESLLQIGNKIKGNITVFVGLRNRRFALFVKGQLSAC